MPTNDNLLFSNLGVTFLHEGLSLACALGSVPPACVGFCSMRFHSNTTVSSEGTFGFLCISFKQSWRRHHSILAGHPQRTLYRVLGHSFVFVSSIYSAQPMSLYTLYLDSDCISRELFLSPLFSSSAYSGKENTFLTLIVDPRLVQAVGCG